MTDIAEKQWSRLFVLVTEDPKTGIVRAQIIRANRPTADVGFQTLRTASMLIEVTDRGDTTVVKNKWGHQGKVEGATVRQEED